MDSQILKTEKHQLLMLTMCLPACSWAQISTTLFDYAITKLGRFLQNVITINFRGRFFSFQHYEKNYRIASMLIITRPLTTPRDVERTESGSMFFETSSSSNESSRKYENIALKSTMAKQWNSLVPQ